MISIVLVFGLAVGTLKRFSLDEMLGEFGVVGVLGTVYLGMAVFGDALAFHIWAMTTLALTFVLPLMLKRYLAESMRPGPWRGRVLRVASVLYGAGLVALSIVAYWVLFIFFVEIIR